MDISWFAAVFGITGAILVGMNLPRVSKWGWISYLIGSFCWLGFGIVQEIWALAITSAVYVVVEARGFYVFSQQR